MNNLENTEKLEDWWYPSEEQMKATRLHQWMKVLGFDHYDDFYKASIDNESWFWSQAEKELGIAWFSRYKNALDLSNGKKWPHFFVEGTLNASHNAVFKWTEKERTKNKKALQWESEDGSHEEYTFTELREKIHTAAGGFKEFGIRKGDVVTLYMPMIPEAVISMMALSQIGAVFSPVFSGYGAEAVASRMEAAGSNILITADGYFRKGKLVRMKKEADRALDAAASAEKLIVVKRTKEDMGWRSAVDISWDEVMLSSPLKKVEEAKSEDPFMLIYTSGTTGKPKGTVHNHGGFPIKAAFDAGICMDVQEDDTFCWYTDMGWMMGPFLVYGALVNGACLMMYEGAPDYPQPNRLWELTEKYHISHLGVSPTLVRSLMQKGTEWTEINDLSSLRVISSTGEPFNPKPWKWLSRTAGRSQTPIINYSGGTETSGGILGNILLKPIGPAMFNSALPGMAADIFNDSGNSVVEEVGELVVKKPWVGMTAGFWKDTERYEKSYWNRWEDTWVHGDWVVKDKEGYWTITGRSDDVITTAGKRVGPAEIESILVEHEAVKEAAAIGVPDKNKGEAVVCFAVLNTEPRDLIHLKEELLQSCADNMGKSLRPSTLFFIEDLPKTLEMEKS
ncbi:AMP-binding protein [Salsuginibacillus kocurii]|uniref:AMP-binding protein n=1 Tax=Salsuginibacillus kocurii TaxID=427078 RepID=UPI00039ABD35